MGSAHADDGFEERWRESLREILTVKFGPLPPAIRERLDTLSCEAIKVLATSAIRARSLRELYLD